MDDQETDKLTFSYSEEMTKFTGNHMGLDQYGAGMVIGFSREGMAPRALGTYNLDVDAVDIDIAAIRTEAEKLAAAGYKRASAPPSFGMRCKTLEVKLGGYTMRNLFDADMSLPPELVPIEEAIGRLMDRAAKKPLATVALKLALSPGAVRVGDPLRVEIDVSNPGIYPADFVSPALFGADGPGSFRLNFWRWTGDPEDPGEYAWTLNLAGRELQVADHKTLSRTDPVQRLEPGTVLKLWTTVPLPRCKRARYLVELVYITPPRSGTVAHDRRMFGEFHADGVPLRVVWRKR